VTTGSEREALIEQVTTAWRETDPDGGVRSHPAWHDLDDAGREQAYEVTRRLRAMEAGLDAHGLSTTAKAVLERIGAPRRSPPA